MTTRKNHPLIKIINNSLVDLPTPTNISLWWNFGSLLGICLMIQIITGIFLAMHYSNNTLLAFTSVIHISRDVNYGWLLRLFHGNGASLFFICMYIHIGRGMYYSSYYLIETWYIGIIIMFMTMGAAFMGYVLPWGQMSFWGATVITNLLSALPYIGTLMVQWLWGAFAIDNATLTPFFTIHFFIPFIIAAMVVIHLLFLHQSGSNNPLGLNSKFNKIPFHPFYSYKDMMGAITQLMALIYVCLIFPLFLGDVENFLSANPLVTPIHIQLEWYFLFAYAILRSIPNKLGGVLSLVLSIAILAILPFTQTLPMKSNKNFFMSQFTFWAFLSFTLLLTWIGARPVEEPFIVLGQILTILYFSYFTFNPSLFKISSNALNKN